VAPPAARPARQTVSPWVSAIAGAVWLAFYAALSPPVAGDKDTGEFALVLATFGLAHPTGYPLYTLAGGAFAHAAHALGASWAQAANLFSALGAGLAMGALHALATRLLAPVAGARAAAALAFLPGLAFGFNPMWTLEATLAEVNAWHVAWVALAALAARSAARAIERGGGAAQRGAAVWGVVVGAGLAHHLTSVLFAVPLTLALAGGAARARAGGGGGALLAAFVAGALVPLASLGWIAWRAWHSAVVQWPELDATWPAVIDHVTGAQYRSFLGRFAPSETHRAHLAQHVFPWLVPALAGAVAALVTRSASERAWRVALATAVLLQVAYAFLYGVRDPAPYFLPALAVGLALFVAGAAGLPALRRHGRAVAIAATLALVVPAIAGVRTAVARNEALARFDGLLRRMWAALPPGPSFVVWDDDMASRLRAFQLLERSRPDVEVVQPRHLTHPAPRRRFVARHGFDPAAGVAPGELAAAGVDESRSATLVDAIAGRINVSSPTPVILFLPAVPSMRQLEKPDSAGVAR
jgi:hypothetical protein